MPFSLFPKRNAKFTHPSPGASLVSGHPLAIGLVALYAMNENAGQTAFSLPNPQNNLICSGVFLDQRGLNLLGATGNTNRAANTAAVGLPTGATAPWTIEVLCATASGATKNGQTIFGFGADPVTGSSNGTERYIEWRSTTGNYQFFGFNANWDTGITFDADNLPHHLVFTFDGTNIRFYRDGLFEGSAANPGFTTASAGIYLGSSVNGTAYVGTVFKAAIYNRALSGSEVSQLFANPYVMLTPAVAGITLFLQPNIPENLLDNGGANWADAIRLDFEPQHFVLLDNGGLNWADAIRLDFEPQHFVLLDNLNNWADSFAAGGTILHLTLADNLTNWLDQFAYVLYPYTLPTFGFDTNQRNWNDGFSFELNPVVLTFGEESVNKWQDSFASSLGTPRFSDTLSMSDMLGLGRGYAFAEDNERNWLDDISYLLRPNLLLVGAQRLIQSDNVSFGYGLVGLSDAWIQLDGFAWQLGTIGPAPDQVLYDFQVDNLFAFCADAMAFGLWIPETETLVDTLTLSDLVQEGYGFGLSFADSNGSNWNDVSLVSYQLPLVLVDSLNDWMDNFRIFWFGLFDSLLLSDSVELAFPLPMVSAPTLAFQATMGGASPPAQMVTVTNFYAGQLVYSATTDVPWLAATPVSGTTPIDIEVSVNSAGLALGTYTGHVYIYGSGPAIITVTLTIGPGDVTIMAGGSTIGIIQASGAGETSFLDVLYRYANLTLPYNPQDPGLTYTYDNSTLADTVILYARFFNLLNEPSTPVIVNAGTGNLTASGGIGFSGLFSCLDVRMFGAIGDGVADDTAAVQKALDKAHSNYQALIATGATAASAGVPLSISGMQLYPDSVGIAGPLGSTVVCIPSGVYCRVYPRIFDFQNIGQPPAGTNQYPSDPPGLVALLIDDGVTLQVDGGLILGYDQGVLEQQAQVNAGLQNQNSGCSTMWILENKYAFTGGPFGPNPGPNPTTYLNATTNWESGPRNTGISVTGEGTFDCGGSTNATEFQTGGWLNELRGGAIRFCKCDNSEITGVTIQDFVSNQGIYWGHSTKCSTFNVLFEHSYGGSVFK